MFTSLAKTTLSLRHSLLRVITPKLYHDLKKLEDPRPMILFVKEHLGNNLRGLEIGVDKGVNAESILKTLSIKKLFLVDPYLPYVSEQYGCKIFYSAENFVKAQNRLSRFNGNTTFIKKTSEDAVNDIPENLDFVYIDGNHKYSFVKKDIELYYPKVKENGIIGGHDFNAEFLGLCKAVMEFANNHNLELHGGIVDWWMIKPKS